ncbi:MAG: TonB-dependent receptor [Muribaculaceae bacterium]|nr:TonB-dependent receptor [Muribaculaceae bacterium]
MNLSRTILPIALSLMPLAGIAKGDISGQILNKESGEPMDFVTVQLIDASSRKPLAIGASTDSDGKFVIPGVEDGKYLVKVMNVGSVEQERPVTIAGANANIGIVRLADDTKVLQELVVEGVRSQMRFELDRKVFQVDADIAAAGTSASELLESIPSVEVDQDGEVSLRGNSSVTVWINGKESGLSADNRAQILEQIPAESIERIEVITNPSAKYSPEGTSGIINIILKKDRRAGYFGAVEVGGNTRGGGNVNGSINFNYGNWEGYASVGWRMRHNKGTSMSERLYDNDTFLNSDGTRRNHGNNLFVRAGATYHFNTKNDMYFNAFGMFGHRWGKNFTDYTSNIPGQWSSNFNHTRNRSNNQGAHVELGYIHRWSDTHYIDVMASYNHWGGPSWNYMHEHYAFDDDIPEIDNYQDQSQHINVNSIEAKIDYTNQLTSWLKLEAGFNGNYNHENTPVETFTADHPNPTTINQDLYNRFIYNNNISALYFTLGGKWNALSFQAGLRGEAWQVKTRSIDFAHRDNYENTVDWFHKNNFALFPSAFLSYSLPHDNELQINYTRRIRRPWGGELNSFRDVSDPNNIRYGNPELQPEYSNAFELNYIKSWTMHMISVSAYLRTSSDVMDRISYLEGNVMYSTSDNVTKQTNSGVEIVGKNSFIRGKLDLTTTINLYNNHISAWSKTFISPTGQKIDLSGKGKDSFAWDVRMMASVKLPWQLSLQATGRYASKMQTAQGSRQGGWSVDAGIRKNLGNWSFSLSCRDIFDSRKFKNTIYGIDYTQFSQHARSGRTLQLTIKYSFGNMKQSKPNRNNSEPMDGSGYGEGMEM